MADEVTLDEEMGTLSWSDLFLANEALWSAYLKREARIAELEQEIADVRAQVAEYRESLR